MKETIRPLGDKILVLPDPLPKFNGTILIPESNKEKPQRGTAIAVGHQISKMPDVVLEMNSMRPDPIYPGAPAIKPGDHVLFAKHAGVKITFDGTEHLLMRESECLAVIENHE